jgi:hypothetical protein
MKQIQVYIRNDLRFTRESMDVTKADQLLREAIRKIDPGLLKALSISSVTSFV